MPTLSADAEVVKKNNTEAATKVYKKQFNIRKEHNRESDKPLFLRQYVLLRFIHLLSKSSLLLRYD